jgi:hypothetical protein
VSIRLFCTTFSAPGARVPILTESEFIVTHFDDDDILAKSPLALVDPKLLIVRSIEIFSPKSANPLLFPNESFISDYDRFMNSLLIVEKYIVFISGTLF